MSGYVIPVVELATEATQRKHHILLHMVRLSTMTRYDDTTTSGRQQEAVAC